jgi:hypothetical protein
MGSLSADDDHHHDHGQEGDDARDDVDDVEDRVEPAEPATLPRGWIGTGESVRSSPR